MQTLNKLNQYFVPYLFGAIFSNFYQSNLFAETGMLDWKPPIVLKISPRAETFKQTYIIQTPALIKNNSAETLSLNSNSTEFMAIVPFKEDFLFGPTVSYSNSALKFRSPAIPRGEKSLQLIKTGLDFTAIKVWDDSNFILGQYHFSYANTKNLNFQSPKNQAALFQLVHAFDADLCLGIGGVIYKSDGKLGALPLLGFGWRPIEEIRIDGWLPSFVYATWNLTEDFFLLTRANAVSDSYTSNDNSLFLAENEVNSNISISEYRLSSGFGISFWGPFQLEVAMGSSFGRKIATTNSQTKEISTTQIKSPVLTRLQLNMKL